MSLKKKIGFWAPLGALFLLAAACQAPLTPWVEAPVHSVNLRLRQDAARTILPNFSLLSLLRLEFSFTYTGALDPAPAAPVLDPFVWNLSSGDFNLAIDLVDGPWTLEVSAFWDPDGAGPSSEVLVARASGNYTGGPSLDLTLRPLANEGEGSFSVAYTVSADTFPVAWEGSITPLEDGVPGTPILLVSGDMTYNSGARILTFTRQNLPAGTYLLRAYLKPASAGESAGAGGGDYSGWLPLLDLVRIYGNLQSQGTKPFRSAPGAGTNLTLTYETLATPTAIYLLWTPVPGASLYDLYRRTNEGAEILLEPDLDSETYLDTEVTLGSRYDYRVVPKTALGEEMTGLAGSNWAQFLDKSSLHVDKAAIQNYLDTLTPTDLILDWPGSIPDSTYNSLSDALSWVNLALNDIQVLETTVNLAAGEAATALALVASTQRPWLFAVDPIGGSDINYGGPSQPFATLQRALTAAPDSGAEIRLATGTYTGSWVIDKNVIIEGGYDPATFSTRTNYTTVLSTTAAEAITVARGLGQPSDFLRLENLVVVYPAASSGTAKGILINGYARPQMNQIRITARGTSSVTGLEISDFASAVLNNVTVYEGSTASGAALGAHFATGSSQKIQLFNSQIRIPSLGDGSQYTTVGLAVSAGQVEALMGNSFGATETPTQAQAQYVRGIDVTGGSLHLASAQIFAGWASGGTINDVVYNPALRHSGGRLTVENSLIHLGQMTVGGPKLNAGVELASSPESFIFTGNTIGNLNAPDIDTGAVGLKIPVSVTSALPADFVIESNLIELTGHSIFAGSPVPVIGLHVSDTSPKLVNNRVYVQPSLSNGAWARGLVVERSSSSLLHNSVYVGGYHLANRALELFTNSGTSVSSTLVNNLFQLDGDPSAFSAVALAWESGSPLTLNRFERNLIASSGTLLELYDGTTPWSTLNESDLNSNALPGGTIRDNFSLAPDLQTSEAGFFSRLMFTAGTPDGIKYGAVDANSLGVTEDALGNARHGAFGAVGAIESNGIQPLSPSVFDYTFDSGSLADSSSNPRPPLSGPETQPAPDRLGQPGKARQLDGTGFLTVPVDLTGKDNTLHHTGYGLSFWIQGPIAAADRLYYSTYSAARGLRLGAANLAGVPHFKIDFKGATLNSIDLSPYQTQWLHVVLSVDWSVPAPGPNATLYLNDTPHPLGIRMNRADLLPGSSNHSIAGESGFPTMNVLGAIDDFKLYPSPVHPGLVNTLYTQFSHQPMPAIPLRDHLVFEVLFNSGAGDSSGRISSPSGTAPSGVTDRFGTFTASQWGGSNEMSYAPGIGFFEFNKDDPGAQQFSVSLWLRNWKHVDAQARSLFSLGNDYELFLFGGASEQYLGYKSGGHFPVGAVASESGNMNALDSSQWMHVTITAHAGQATDNYKVYVNGALFNTVSRPAATFWAADTSSSGYTLGKSNGVPGQTLNFQGEMDDVRVYGKVLSPLEVQGLWAEKMYQYLAP